MKTLQLNCTSLFTMHLTGDYPNMFMKSYSQKIQELYICLLDLSQITLIIEKKNLGEVYFGIFKQEH